MAFFSRDAFPKVRTILLAIVALIVFGSFGLVLFAWSGLYSVAARRGHFAIVEWFLDFGMRNSVELHARGITAPPLDHPALVERGIGHVHGGCAPCHGAPGVPASPIAQQMLPSAPDLAKVVGRWTPEQLFWIVKHGLKYTGMPGWTAPVRDDEVWAVVAVLVRLPEMSADTYRRLAMIDGDPADTARLISAAGFIDGDPIACARCHGVRGTGSPAGGVPNLVGQRPEYLRMTLRDYELGTRPSGIMHPVAIYLSDEDRRNLARYYAGLTIPAEQEPNSSSAIKGTTDASLVELGATLANAGVAARGIPACSACHGEDGRAEGLDPRFPALAGQHFDYLLHQLTLWRAGTRGGTFGELMSAVVRNLTDQEMQAVAAYYASLGHR